MRATKRAHVFHYGELTPSTSTFTLGGTSSIAFRTSATATSEGVVTTTRTSHRHGLVNRQTQTSPVPGGKSITSSPTRPTPRPAQNWVITLMADRPRQIPACRPYQRPIELNFHACAFTGIIAAPSGHRLCRLAELIAIRPVHDPRPANPRLVSIFRPRQCQFTATVFSLRALSAGHGQQVFHTCFFPALCGAWLLSRIVPGGNVVPLFS